MPDRAASTGNGTVALRAIESGRGTRALIADPLAALLAGEEGLRWAQSLTVGQRELMLDLIAVRTRFIDEVCTGFAHASRPRRQILILGAGYDTRAYRLPALAESAVFEADYPSVLGHKAARLREAGNVPLCRKHRHVAIDLEQQPLRGPLLAAGFDPATPSLWVLEGVTGYLPEECCARLFTQMRELSAPGSAAVVTFVGASGRAYGPDAPVSERHIFCTDSGQLLLNRAGWDAVQLPISDVAVRYQRASRLRVYDYWLAQAVTRP